MKRRDFLRSFALGAAAAVAVAPTKAAASFITTEELEVVRTELVYPKLHPDLEGFRFGFLSDFHLGGWVKDDLVNEALRLTSAEGVEALFHGGDYLWVPDSPQKRVVDSFINDSFTGETDEEVAISVYSRLAEIASAYSFPLGSFGVLGNHDRWSNFEAAAVYLPQAGIERLENTLVTIKRGKARVEVFGSADYWTGIPQLPAYSKHSADSFRILLTHNPDFASHAFHEKRAQFHLALAGHTHGGQIKLPGLGPLTYNVQDRRYGEGLVDYGDTKFYTTRGVGVVELPFRVACPPEVSILTLRRG